MPLKKSKDERMPTETFDSFNDAINRDKVIKKRFVVFTNALLGDILPKKCAKCGTTEGKFQIHHKKYRYPVDVNDMERLCLRCHQELHSVSRNRFFLNPQKLKQFLGFINDHLSQKEIQEKLNTPKGTVSKWFKRLEKDGFVSSSAHTKPRFWDLTEKGKQAIEANVSKGSLSITPNTFRLHNFSVQLDIIADNSKGFWEKSWDLNNWKKQFKRLQDVGVSVERTPKTLTINFQPQKIREEQVFPLAMAGTVSVMGYLANEGIELDLFSARISRQEYGSPEPLVRKQVEQGMTFRQSLGRVQERIMPSDTPKEAFVWFDASQGPERDTNDLAHMRNVAIMPERVAEIEKAIQGSLQTLHALANTQNLMAAGWKLTMEKTRKIEKNIKILSQKSIREYTR